MDGNTLALVNSLSIDDKMELYAHLADSIIDVAFKEDGIILEVFRVKLVKMEMLFSNDYNPNRMPNVEMGLLKECVIKYGYLFPTITTFDKDRQKYRIIDGWHRYEDFKRAGRKWMAILDMKLPYHDAVQLTVLMNRIKGLHQVELMSDLVLKLENLGLEDSEICENLGMEAEEFLRLKQQLGIAHSFRNHNYSHSWEIEK